MNQSDHVQNGSYDIVVKNINAAHQDEVTALFGPLME